MANGSDQSVTLNFLESELMSRQQIAEAQRLAREWMEMHN